MNLLEGQYCDEHLALHWEDETVLLDSRRLNLTRKEYELLAFLVQHAGEIIPRGELLGRVWGYRAGIRTRTLDVHVRRVRRKLGQYANLYIETVFGMGYRFQPYDTPRYVQEPVALAASA